MCTREEKWHHKGSHSSSVSSSNRLVTSNLEKSDRLVHCSVKNAVLCETIVKDTQIWTSPSEEEKHFGRLVTFWFGTFAMLFSTTGCVVRHKNTRRWTVGVITAYKLAVLEIWEICISMYCVSALSLHIESTDLGGDCNFYFTFSFNY